MLLTTLLTVALVPSLLSAQVVTRLGTEFQINTYTTDTQEGPAVAAAGNGNLIVVWNSYRQDGSDFGIFGQRYASNGSPLGTEFPINTYTSSDQRYPAVASAIDGDFVVVWGSYGDGSLLGVFGQRFASSGSRLGTEFQVNTYTTGPQGDPAVAVAGNGDFVVVWDGGGSGISGQRYASSGSPLGTEFQVNTFSAYGQSFPAVASASNGDFIAVWVSYGQDGSYDGVFGQRYASGGSPLGTEFQVNTYTTNFQDVPAVAAASNGDFVVVWQSEEGTSLGVFGQRYASSGSPLGTEFDITYTTASPFPAVAAASNGDFTVVWETQDGDRSGVFGQRYTSSGSSLGTEFQVNTYTASFQGNAAIAAAGNGDFVVVWQSPQDGSAYGIFGQRYGVVGCAPTPLGSCATPGKSALLIKDKSPGGASAKDKLIWKWLNGPPPAQADFGDPTVTAHYKFCIYSGTAQTLAMEAVVPQATNWQQLSDKGYKYKDKTGSAAGITQILLKGGSSAKILVKGKDGNLDLTASTLPLNSSADVIVQLSNTDNSNCWQGEFPTTSVKKNTAGEFKAKTP